MVTNQWQLLHLDGDAWQEPQLDVVREDSPCEELILAKLENSFSRSVCPHLGHST